MNKAIGILLASMLMLCSMAMAAPATGVSAWKSILVTGNYVDDGVNWVIPTPLPVTATYNMQANSPAATVGGYFEIETFGEAWFLDYEGHTMANKAGTMQNDVHAWTVNPPDTTRGTDWTKYDYEQNNFASFTSSHLEVHGFGAVDISSMFNAQSGFQQDAYLDINN